MRDFNSPRGALGRLSPGARLLYLVFIGLTLLGFASAMALYYDSLGIGASTAATYYLGNGDNPSAAELIVEKSPRELLETAHFHLFSMPVVLLILGHLFLLARGGRWKSWVVGAASALTLLHVAGPWVIRYGGAAWGWVMPATGIPFLVLYLVMAVWPVPELVRGRAMRD